MDTALLGRLPSTWVETKLRDKHIAWGLFVILFCTFLFVIEISYSLRPDVDNLVGIALYDFVIEAYTLTAWAFIRSSLAQSLKALRPLIENFSEPVSGGQKEWQFTFGIGVPLLLLTVFTNPVITASLNQPTTWLYILSQLIEDCVLGWIVFGLLASANQITQFISQVSVINVFDPSPYRPVAQWCLVVEASIMGAVTIAILFLGKDIMDESNLATYFITGVLGVFVFFAGMWSTHQHMLRNKESEVSRINAELLSLHREIMTRVNNREFDTARQFMDASAGLELHKNVVEKAPEWPYTVGSLGGLVSTVMVPVVINFLSKIF